MSDAHFVAAPGRCGDAGATITSLGAPNHTEDGGAEAVWFNVTLPAGRSRICACVNTATPFELANGAPACVPQPIPASSGGSPLLSNPDTSVPAIYGYTMSMTIVSDPQGV